MIYQDRHVAKLIFENWHLLIHNMQVLLHNAMSNPFKTKTISDNTRYCKDIFKLS